MASLRQADGADVPSSKVTVPRNREHLAAPESAAAPKQTPQHQANAMVQESSNQVRPSTPQAISAVAHLADLPLISQTGGNPSTSSSSSNNAIAQGGEAPDPDVLRDYRFRLAKQVRQFRRYPVQARQRGWEGQVELTLQYLPATGGRVSVTRSSAYEILDKQALEMIQNAFNATDLPVGLKSKSFRLVLPIDFRLDED